MNRMKSRRARFGVESLEGRKLTALYDAFLKIEGFDARPAEVQDGQDDGQQGEDILIGDNASLDRSSIGLR